MSKARFTPRRVILVSIFGFGVAGFLLSCNPSNSPQAGADEPTRVGGRVGAGFTPDARGVAHAKLMLLDDFRAYIGGKQVVGDWSNVVPLSERTTSHELYAYYNGNEVAGDERFKGKSVVLTGQINKISKDVFGSVYLELEAGGLLESVQAYLAEETASGAGSFSRGASVTLICKGGGMALIFPVLKDCQTDEVTLTLQRPAIERTADNLFAGNAELPDGTKLWIGYFYALGVAMPRGNPCETAELGKPIIDDACGAAMRMISKSAVADSYTALAKQIRLPPLPASLRATEPSSQNSAAPAAVPPATEQTSLTPNQGPPLAADTSPAANKKFLEDNGKRDGVKTTQDGLQYRVIKAGTGKTPMAPTDDNVTVLYKGQLITGMVFDQTMEGMPATFPAGVLIPGWVEALRMMKEGDEWELVIPAELGYGEASAGGIIPPNQTLIFQVALLKVN